MPCSFTVTSFQRTQCFYIDHVLRPKSNSWVAFYMNILSSKYPKEFIQWVIMFKYVPVRVPTMCQFVVGFVEHYKASYMYPSSRLLSREMGVIIVTQSVAKGCNRDECKWHRSHRVE